MDDITLSFQRRIATPGGSRGGNRTRRHQGPTSSATKQRLSKKEQKSLETRDRILDSAEELFALHGLYGVTVRNVAKHAGIDTALIHYYFGTKRGLFDGVFSRRAEGINRERLASMDVYERANIGTITIEGALQAFLEPILERNRSGDRGWRNFTALVALANNSQEWGGSMMSRTFDPVIHRLMDLLRKAMPQAADEDLYWSYQMFSGSLMVLLAATDRIALLSGGLCQPNDVEAYAERMVNYAAAGFRAVCEKD
jgi:AcrR family transcriptional regulator